MLVLGIGVGLVSSFVQSLGEQRTSSRCSCRSLCVARLTLTRCAALTIQRKSHLQNEARTPEERKPDYRRPLWIASFLVYILANISGPSWMSLAHYHGQLTLAWLAGTVFQIGALPIVVLGPLGACSLLYNALFAGVILGDNFSLKLLSGAHPSLRIWGTPSSRFARASGTVLIAGGAALIGVFGIVPEESHTLEELVRLYCRAQFIAWIALLCIVLAFAIVCVSAYEGLSKPPYCS